MNKKNSRPAYLKVIEGKKKQEKPAPLKMKGQGSSKPVYLLLLLLTSFLTLQTLIGWVWGTAGQCSQLNTILAQESEVDVSFTVPGIITFDEKVLLAPCSGFVYYTVNEGQRVPVGKKLAVVATSPREPENEIMEETTGERESLQRFKEWFLGEKNVSEEVDRSMPLFPQEDIVVSAPQPGLVSFCLGGLEEFGPEGSFPYFSAEELQDKICAAEPLPPGEKVQGAFPLLKIINNYYWYFSAVFPPNLGGLVANEPEMKLYFNFAPGIPVWGEQVEMRERAADGMLEVTWRIGREVPDLYNQRWCEAEVVYQKLPGLLVPKHALVEVEGKAGVYLLEKGLVRFRKVDLLLEREDDVLIKKWEDQPRIITNPEHVKEGQRYKW